MKKEDILLPGEDFGWHEESGLMLQDDYQQAEAVIVMDNWISIFGGQMWQPNVEELSAESTPDILTFYQEVMKAFIVMLKKVKLYPDCISDKCDYIFKRTASIEELTEVYHRLQKLEKRYNKLMFLGIECCKESDIMLEEG